MAKLWGSRFLKGTDALADKFSFSISYDYRLAKYDVRVSIAHAAMLGQCKIISRQDASRIVTGLKKIGKQIKKGTFPIDANAEDIHTHIQSTLKKLIGPAADKLHTARSRNDLVVTDMKLYCKDELTEIIRLVKQLQKSLVTFASKNKTILIPAYTHLQSAQVVLLAHYILAFVEMLQRDKGRLTDTLTRADSMPLGSCALSGSTLSTNRNYLAKKLEFKTVAHNSIDAVSDRDFIVEGLSSLAILGIHCSRMAEDLILWSTTEFNFVDIDWSLCTGSSIMAHKKNPDILELIRGETATLVSNLNQILILLKGLPLTYNRDMQLDKPPLFESMDKTKSILILLEKTFKTLKVNKAGIEKQIHNEALFSVDIMEYLIKKGISYREAHEIVGKLFKHCLDKGKSISNLSESQLKLFCPQLGRDVKKLLNPLVSVKIKKSSGSTNPQEVMKKIQNWKKMLNA